MLPRGSPQALSAPALSVPALSGRLLSGQGGALGVIFVEIRRITRRDWRSAPKERPPRRSSSRLALGPAPIRRTGPAARHSRLVQDTELGGHSTGLSGVSIRPPTLAPGITCSSSPKCAGLTGGITRMSAST